MSEEERFGDGSDSLPDPRDLVAELEEPPHPQMADLVAETIHRRVAARQLTDLTFLGLWKVVLEYLRLFLRLFENADTRSEEPTNAD